MNKRLLLMLCFCNSVFAESESLPPVIDNSSYYSGDYANQTAAPAQVNGGTVTYSNKGANSANAVYEVLGQLEQLQKELRQLSGTVEEQAHELAEIKKRQTTMYDDIDQRLQSVESAKGTNAAAPAAEVSVPVAEASSPAPAAPAPEAATAAEQPAAPAPVATLTPPASAAPDSASQYPKEIYSEAKPAIPAPPKPSEKEQYQSAYDTLRDGHYTRAIEALNALLVNYPNGEYASNAQYWLGEAHKVSQNIPASREAFNKVISNYPTSPKVPDALLKLGYLELEQDNVAKARDYLTRVSTGYPNTTAAHLAAKKLGALNGAPQ